MKKFKFLRKEMLNYQTEGTWAIPDNPKAKKELKALLAKPLILGKEGDQAADKLYNIIGDDELFDDLFVAGKKNPKGDARPLIKKAMKRLKIKEDIENAVEYARAADIDVMESVTEKKKETVSDFLKRGGKITKVKSGTGKAGRAAMDKFKKSYGRMKDKEAEKDQEVNELSKKTYKSYIAKAKKSQKELEKQHQKAHDDAGPAHSMPYGDWKKQKMSGDKARDKAINRRYMQRIAKSKIDPTFDPRTDAKKAWDASQGGKDPQRWKKYKKTATRLGSTRNAESTEFNEATDIFNKGGIHVTRFAMGGGKLGFQFNFGKVGRYIQIPLEKLSVLDQAVKMAKKAGKTGKQGNLPIADDVNEKTDRWYEDQPEWGTPESTDHAKKMTPGEYAESTAAYAKSLEKIARDRQLSAISDKDKQTLMKIAAMLSKEKKK